MLLGPQSAGNLQEEEEEENEEEEEAGSKVQSQRLKRRMKEAEILK